MAQRGHGEGSVYQRSDGRWCISVRLPGGKRVVRYAQTRKDAATVLSELTRRRRVGQLAPTTKMTVKEWITEWLDLRRPYLRPKTVRNYSTAVRIHIVPTLGGVRLSRLAPLHVDYVVADLAAQHADMARLVYAVLRMSCAAAVRAGLLGANPVEGLLPPRVHRPERPIWDEPELTTFLRVSADDRFSALWALLVGTGVRIGEALGLQWEDVDWEAGTVRVRRSLSQVDGRMSLGEPKSNAGLRTIALPAFVVTRLRTWKAHQSAERLRAGVDWQDARHAVFTEPDGMSTPYSRAYRRFQVVRRRSRVTRISLHGLRHVHASFAVASGADAKTLQVRLGHATVAMSMDVYAHRVQGGDQRIADAFDRLASSS